MGRGPSPVSVTARWYVADIGAVRAFDPAFDQRPRSEKPTIVRACGRQDGGAVHNLVTNALLEAFVDAVDPNQGTTTAATHLAIGTGDPPEDVTATSLASEQERFAVTNSSVSDTTATFVTFIGTDEANGTTISEFGLTTAASGGSLLNRANISDQPIEKNAGVTATIDVSINTVDAGDIIPVEFGNAWVVGDESASEPHRFDFDTDSVDTDSNPLANLGDWESGGAIDWATSSSGSDPDIYYTFNYVDETFNGYNGSSWDTTLATPSGGIPSEAPLAFDGIDNIWSIGGYSKDSANRQSVAERVASYDISADSWSEAYTDQNIDSSGHHVERVGSWLYVMGGYTVASGAADPAASMRRYNWETDTWDYSLTDIPAGAAVDNAFLSNQATEVGRFIYVAVEDQHVRYDTVSDEWSTLEPMNDTTRRFHALESDGTEVYAFGGQNSGTSAALTSIEKYDPSTDSWTTLGDTLTAGGQGLSAAAFGDPGGFISPT